VLLVDKKIIVNTAAMRKFEVIFLVFYFSYN